MPEGQTEEEYGQEFWILAYAETSSCTLDFAVPLPTSLTLGHLEVNCPKGARETTLGCLPGRRFDSFAVLIHRIKGLSQTIHPGGYSSGVLFVNLPW